MNERPKRLIKTPENLKEFLIVNDIKIDDGVADHFNVKLNKKKFKQLSFTCNKCNLKFINRNELLVHIKKHKEKETFLCEDCGKSLSSSQAFSEHMNIHKNIKPHKCEICGHESRQLSVHSRHLLTHEKNPSQKFNCLICSKKFTQKSYLVVHMRKHLGEKPHKCEDCGKCFTARTELNRHRRSHSSVRPYACIHCNKRFKLRHNLNAHVKAHVGKQTWRCSLCKATFSQQSAMEKHKKGHNEVVQHLELVKQDARTLTVTTLPLDARRVARRQKLLLPPHLDLNDCSNAANKTVSLGLGDAFIPLSVVANSFGTGNYIKMKIVDRLPTQQVVSGVEGQLPTARSIGGVTDVVLVGAEELSKRHRQHNSPERSEYDEAVDQTIGKGSIASPCMIAGEHLQSLRSHLSLPSEEASAVEEDYAAKELSAQLCEEIHFVLTKTQLYLLEMCSKRKNKDSPETARKTNPTLSNVKDDCDQLNTQASVGMRQSEQSSAEENIVPLIQKSYSALSELLQKHFESALS